MISKSRLKQIKYLHTAKGRNESRQFIAEGEKTVLELLEQRSAVIVELFITKDVAGEILKKARIHNISVNEVSDMELGQISLQKTPNKTLAICNYFEPVQEIGLSDANISIYLDDIRDPGNFGTIIRLCDWFGIHTLYCSPSTCDLYNPKVIQSSMGAFMRVNVMYVELQKLINDNNIQRVYGAVLDGNSLYREQFEGGLMVIGNESNGITAPNLSLINKKIKIPSHPSSKTESLNAAMATSVIISEIFRQRS